MNEEQNTLEITARPFSASFRAIDIVSVDGLSLAIAGGEMAVSL